jgi:hypothetical protein
MDDFTNQLQIDDFVSVPTLEDWQEYHDWLISNGEVELDEQEWLEIYGPFDYDREQE